MTGTAIDERPFFSTVVEITGYKDAQFILASREFVSNRNGGYSGQYDFRTVAAIDGQEHRERRHREMDLFGGPELLRYEREILKPMLERLLDDCRRNRPNSGLPDGTAKLDLVETSRNLLVYVGARIAGVDGIDTPVMATRLMHFVNWWAVGNSLRFTKLSPEEAKQRFEEAQAVAEQWKKELFQPSYERRRALVDGFHAGTVKKEALPRDVLTQLMLHPVDDWDDRMLLRETSIFLTASIGTTARALTNAVDEILRWLKKNPAHADLMSDPKAQRLAVEEALRMHPALPAMPRLATADATLPSGQFIPKGTQLAVMLTPLGRDKGVFGADADEFDPFRYQRLPQGVPPYGLAFGGGAHTCIGRRLAVGPAIEGPAETSNFGTLHTLVATFFAAGVQLDPQDPPVRNEKSFYDEFLVYPVRLTKL
jgi:cytochrome P450